MNPAITQRAGNKRVKACEPENHQHTNSMGKGAGVCEERAGMVLEAPVAAKSPLTLLAEETDEKKLLKALAKVESYPEYSVIIFRLAQLRDEHAVTGILTSKEYKDARTSYEVALGKVEAARAALSAFEERQGGKWTPNTAEMQMLEERVLGLGWEYDIAKEQLALHPEYAALSKEIEQLNAAPVKAARKPKGSGEIKEMEKKIKVATIRKGPLSDEVKALRKEKAALEAGLDDTTRGGDDADRVAKIEELEKQRKKLQDQLLGKEQIDEYGITSFAGGKLDLTRAYAQHRENAEVEIQIAVDEERLTRKHSGGKAERAALIRAERELEEGHHSIRVHEAALKRAKLRAKAAKQRKLVLEPQHFDKSFEAQLKKQPDQLVALFVEDSCMRDHTMHMSYNKKKNSYELVGELDHGREEKPLLEALAKAGAKDTTYDIETANYNSWASSAMKGLHAVQYKKSGVELAYTPRKVDGKKKGQAAPLSEQGVVRLTGKDPKVLVKELEKLKVHKGLCAEVPYDVIYRGSHRYGRVTPLYEPLASGREALKIPDGHMVIHGLTGAGHDGGASKHFDNIVKSGGLKSIAERRRMGITSMTSSPIGDIASGIDMGVPCKVGSSTLFGSGIYFGMHPETLNRRDLWFTDHDFGGGDDRNKQYQAYAKKLGQKSLQEPCPVKGRQKHLDTGLGNTNEVYFANEISWNDVDTIFADSSVGGDIKKKVAAYKQSGLLPEHIRVEIQGQTPVGEKKPGNAVVSSAGGWTVLGTGEVVYIDEAKEGEGKAPTWNINQLIQRRAREIEQTLE